jgi:hypothetical protein
VGGRRRPLRRHRRRARAARSFCFGISTLPLAAFSSRYQGNGTWTHTYFTAAHEVYTARLDALADGHGLDAATDRAGWRMLVEHRGDVVAAAEVPAAGGGRATPQGQMNRGAFVRSTVDAITSAEQEDRVRDSDFALRLLRVPALHLTALWLRGTDGTDVIVPPAPAPRPFEPNRSYDAEEFAARAAELAGAARKRWRAVDRPHEAGG